MSGLSGLSGRIWFADANQFFYSALRAPFGSHWGRRPLRSFLPKKSPLRGGENRPTGLRPGNSDKPRLRLGRERLTPFAAPGPIRLRRVQSAPPAGKSPQPGRLRAFASGYFMHGILRAGYSFRITFLYRSIGMGSSDSRQSKVFTTVTGVSPSYPLTMTVSPAFTSSISQR